MLTLIAIPAAYRLKGMGDFSRDYLFPVIGLIVGLSLWVALQCHWEFISLLGGLFVIGAMPGHDKYFSAITGIESDHKGIAWIDAIVDRLIPQNQDISQTPDVRNRLRGSLGMFLRGVYYQPLFIATGLLSGAGLVNAVTMGLAFQLSYALAYLGSSYIVNRLYAVVPANGYNVFAEWSVGTALMLCLSAVV